MAASVASMIDQFNMPNIQLLQELGYEVHVACNFKQGNTCDARRIRKLLKRLTAMRVCCHQWDCPRKPVPIEKSFRAYCQMLCLLKAHQFMWVHCQSPIGGALARMAAYRCKVAVVYTAHGFHFYKGASMFQWLLYYPVEKILSHVTDILVTVNREDFWFAKKKLRAGSVFHIPGVGINIKRFTEKKECSRDQFLKHFYLPANARVLLSVGELNAGKNHRMVVEALASLRQQDVYYLICGQGRLKKKLQQYAEGLGVGKYIRLPGFQEEMSWIYQHADIFVFPSIREGMPVALMEAMAAGLPCIVSDIRGNCELIGKKGGGRFALQAPEQLQALLLQYLKNPQIRKRSGLYNQKKVRQYDNSVVKRKMLRIYGQMQQIEKGRGNT